LNDQDQGYVLKWMAQGDGKWMLYRCGGDSDLYTIAEWNSIGEADGLLLNRSSGEDEVFSLNNDVVSGWATLEMDWDAGNSKITVFRNGVKQFEVVDSTYTSFDRLAVMTFTGTHRHLWDNIRVATLTPGDANGDGKVDVSDLGILAANYGMTSGATLDKGDFNGDGKVDVSDLGILAANYGTGTQADADFNADYAKVFGAAADENATEDTTSSACSSLGLSLIAGLALVGLMLVKWEE
jgi:hypothetical protein